MTSAHSWCRYAPPPVWPLPSMVRLTAFASGYSLPHSLRTASAPDFTTTSLSTMLSLNHCGMSVDAFATASHSASVTPPSVMAFQASAAPSPEQMLRNPQHTALLPPACSSGAFSKMTTCDPAAAALMAAAWPANPYPITTTSVSASHASGSTARLPAAAEALPASEHPAMPMTAAPAAATAAPLRKSRRPSVCSLFFPMVVPLPSIRGTFDIRTRPRDDSSGRALSDRSRPRARYGSSCR